MFARSTIRALAPAMLLLAGVFAFGASGAYADKPKAKPPKAPRGADAGPGRLLRAKGSSWLWFLDSFNTRHRIVSVEVHKKWWQHGPKIEEVVPGDLERFRIGEEMVT